MEINNFLNEYENVTNNLIENLYSFTKYIRMNKEAQKTVTNWKEETLNYHNQFVKYNKIRVQLSLLWKNKYEKIATVKMKEKCKKIENKMKNLEYNGIKMIVDSESNVTNFL